MNRLYEHYEDIIRSDLISRFNYSNIMEVPKIVKIVIHITFKNIGSDKSHVLPSMLALELISGQKPVKVKAKKSMASFKIKKGGYVSCKVTLRHENMYNFLDRLITSVFPRMRDFKGISFKKFDDSGNYSFGIHDFLAFPEIEADYDLFDSVYGMDITIVTNTRNKVESQALLSSFQMPLINN